MKDYFKKLYYEACDLLSSELEGRFQPQYISPVLSMEQLLIKAANNKNVESEMKMVKESCFSKDIPFFDLSKQLPLLHDMVKTALPNVKSVTSLNTICDAMNTNNIFKDMFSSVHLVHRLQLTSPITSATSEIGLGKRFEYSNLRSFTAHSKLNFSLRSFAAMPTSMFAHAHFYNLNVWLKLWVCSRNVEAVLLAVSA